MANSAESLDLRSQGGQITARPDLNGLTRRLASRGLYSRFGDLRGKKDDVICLSMGAVGDCLWIPDLLRCYWESEIPWVVLVQSNAEHMISSEDQRETLRGFYAKARRVVFVSRQNMELAERQLACRFNNAVVLPNPIRERLGGSLFL